MTEIDIIIRLTLSCILAGLIGFEREMRHKPAGLRTILLVGIGSTLVMLTSIYISQIDQGDVARIAGGVLTGIGFLGAGVIIRGQDEKDHGMVQNITTAATIWVVAAIGLAVGMGFYFAAILTALIVLAILFGLNTEHLKTIHK